jgi:hypothetical protein
MRALAVFTTIALIIFLVACDSKQMSTQIPESPTGEVTRTVAPAQQKTAAEAILDLKAQLQNPTAQTAKRGTSMFFAPANMTATTRADRRKLVIERMRAAMRSGVGVPQQVKASTAFGARYHTKTGEAINLPAHYLAGRRE